MSERTILRTFTSEEWEGSAVFSLCLKYRYLLTREWDTRKGTLMVVGLNPSTATEEEDDRTIFKCLKFAKGWGYGKLAMLNIFAYRATEPEDMKAHPSPVGEYNDEFLLQYAEQADTVLCAWGTHGKHWGRGIMVREILKEIAALHVLRLTKHKYPEHPLYMKDSTLPQLWA